MNFLFVCTQLLASASYDDTIRLFGPSPADSEQQFGAGGDEWDCVYSLGGGPSAHESTVWALAFEPRDGSRLLSASDDRTLKIWSCTNILALYLESFLLSSSLLLLQD